MDCEEEAIIRYFTKPRDFLRRFYHRIKTPLVRSVNRPFSLKVRKRLSHVSDLKEMDKFLKGHNLEINEMVTEDFNVVHEIEFVDLEEARIEPTNDTENGTVNMDNSEINWDNDEECPNLNQLSVQPIQPYVEFVQPYNEVDQPHNAVNQPYNEVDQPYNEVDQLQNAVDQLYNEVEQPFNQVTTEAMTDSESMLSGTLRWTARSGSMLTLADGEIFTNWNQSEVWNMGHDELDLPTNSINIDDDLNMYSENSIAQPLNEVIANAISQTDTDPESMDRCSRGLLRFTFKIENATEFFYRNYKATSQSFKCRNLSFSLNVINRSVTTTGVYLQRDKNENHLYDGLDILASCELTAVNPLNKRKHYKLFDKHLFNDGSDWGFPDFFSGVNRSRYVHNDSLLFEVEVKADPPYCYSNFSRKIFGYVGIRNQGATCYMNSLLQTLFLLPKFRTSCYRIPTEMDDNNSIALALQQVFYNLQFSDTAVNTKNLTKSFGWSSMDVLTQHDIQEMMRILIDKIEHRMKNTLLEPIIPDMFQGKFISYVKCRDVEFNSQREEVFYDIQLSLENADNLYKSFENYTASEIMDNENKYDAGKFGLQAAEKGTLFLNLPPVMFLHLLRFQFDPTTNQVVKNNNFFEFYDQLDLTKYVCKDENTSWKYTLFAVLSHSGSGSKGHYVAYVNPTLKQNWLKFDDDTISSVHKSDAIDSNFGSAKDADEWTRSMQFNAYMLVYIRDNDAEEILAPVNPMYITEELATSAKLYAAQEFSNNSTKHHFTNDINVYLTSILESDLHFELSKIYHESVASMPKFAVSRNTTANEFKNTLQEVFNIRHENQIRIWPIIHSKTSLSQPIFIQADQSIVQLLSKFRDCSTYGFAVWAEMALPGCVLPQFDQFEHVVIFYYYYSAHNRCYYYIDYGYHDKNTKIDELVPLLNEMMDCSNRELNIYQETAEAEIQELIMSNRLLDYANPKNETFVMKIVFEPKEHDETTELHSIRLHYNHSAAQVHLTMRNEDATKSEKVITISVNTTFPELLNNLAVLVTHDPKKIQIFKCHPRGDGRGEAIPSTSTKSLSTLLNCVGRQRLLLYYKLLHVDVINVETKQIFRFRCYIDIEKYEWFELYITDNDTIENILAAAAKLINPDKQFRLLLCTYDNDRVKLIKDSRQIFQHLDTVLQLNKKLFQIEEIPKGDEILNENEKYVVVIHASNHLKNSGHPFIAKVNLNEAWKSVKDGLRRRLNISELNWKDYRPVLLDQDKKELDIDDTNCLSDFDANATRFFIHFNFIHLRNKNKRYITYSVQLD